MKTLTAALAAGLLVASTGTATARPITVKDLLAIPRASDLSLSPDGKQLLYTIATPDVGQNRSVRNVWLVAVAGGEAKAITSSGRDSGARWSPDGKRIAFLGTRDGSTQIYLASPDGSNPTRLTSLSGDADNIVWAPDGKSIAFTSQVYPGCKDEACNVERDKAAATGSKARVYEGLLYRHWTEWRDGKRAHLFIVPVAGGAPRDLTPGADYDVPPPQREGPHPIAFAPDSQTLCFTAVTDAVEAVSTNGDLFEVPAAGGAPKRLTTNPGFDGGPAYSPDGKTIAYHAQFSAVNESDRWRLMLLDRATGRERSLIESFDRSVDTIAWNAKGDTLYFNAEDRGEMPIFSVPVTGGTPKALTPGTFNGEFALGPDGTLVVERVSLARPADIYVVSPSGADRALVKPADAALAGVELTKAESFSFASNDGTSIQGFVVRPPAFDAAKKYPVIMLLHGGPQTMWGNSWSYRWNAQMFASTGSVVVMINRRGSTGFGQAFTDEISNDWGGKAYEDVMRGLDYVLATYPFMDGARVAAAGASYGGYMVDWLASHARGRFKTFVSHAGVYNLASMYGATEELWFPEHEFAGTPWSNKASYDLWSPSSYAAAFGVYKTPTLVICGELDFRVPYTQSLEFYTALQRQQVPSKLIVFPDEGHWILKPQNAVKWYGEVLGWLGHHLG